MSMPDERGVSPQSAADAIEELRAAGALDALFAKIDAGEVQLTGNGGLVPGLIKAALERGLQAELSDHLHYEKGDPEARFYPNARNGASAKTVASEAGDIALGDPSRPGRDVHAPAGPEGVPAARRLG